MKIGKPQLIAAGFIIFGALLCAVGTYMSFASHTDLKPEARQYQPPGNQYYNSAPAPQQQPSSNSYSAAKQTAKKEAAPEKPETPAKAVTAETKPVVKETPPYPAPAGQKWTRAKNGWILGYADGYKPPQQPQAIATTNTQKPVNSSSQKTQVRCEWMTIGGKRICVQVAN